MTILVNKSTNSVFYATPFSAGFDIPANEDTELPVGMFKAISTGLYLDQLDIDLKNPQMTLQFATLDRFSVVYELQIRSRSGLAFKNGVSVINSPGTIDADYPGEIKVILINHGGTTFEIKKGDRIAQGVFNLVLRPKEISIKTDTRKDGFGSTGV